MEDAAEFFQGAVTAFPPESEKRTILVRKRRCHFLLPHHFIDTGIECIYLGLCFFTLLVGSGTMRIRFSNFVRITDIGRAVSHECPQCFRYMRTHVPAKR